MNIYVLQVVVIHLAVLDFQQDPDHRNLEFLGGKVMKIFISE